ncbi:hypothetical protein MKW92_012953 [Papaver armeniacum]|nr:hypothetical protein MKW92_012953 [Papaver armeniacum]
MGLVQRVVFCMVLAALCVASSMAEVYKVGDDNGWTTQNMPDYKRWSASKTFKIGDSIVFEYSPKDNNVVQVMSYDDYKKCNGSSPLKTFTSGKDTIPIKHKEHLFFISGFPDNCQKGQKVDIRVLDTSVVPIPPLAQRPSSSAPAPSPSVSVPAPSPNSAMSISKGITGKFGFVILAVVAAVAY